MIPSRRLILLYALAIHILPSLGFASGTFAASTTSILESAIHQRELTHKATAEAAMDSDVGAAGGIAVGQVGCASQIQVTFAIG